MKAKVLVLFALFCVANSSCTLPTTKGTGGTNGSATPGPTPNRNPRLSFDSESFNGSDQICSFVTDYVETGQTTLTRITVSALAGPVPSAVSVERTNSPSNDNDPIPSINRSGNRWEATTTASNCNTPLGCASGNYRVNITIPNGQPDGCTASVEDPTLLLELQDSYN